ncbi:hypothetical protein GCM10023206_14920 [Acinetobacter puyangensis]|uniref:Uncharacterized protein n=1 Tax=Acinetobacter puyangensis TaxID=1096779 RepID=A0A240E998_9GAMM|nr:hypothetical protein [Acinetobacter puyangensis]SNX44789.1 hypothetical protein SAMN05421731_104148 [Acinetobacter puyangensis]
MAFDFISYIAQQVGQQQPNLLADEPKQVKNRYLIHLIAFQLSALIETAQQDENKVYEKIQQLNSNWLADITQQTITHDQQALEYFQPISTKLSDISHKVATLMINEITQLDQNAHLGISGIKELLDGQYVWMQDQVEQWFWDSINHPEFKSLTSAQPSNEPDFDEIMQEFNHMLQQQAQHNPQDHATTHSTLADVTPIAPSIFFKILNPLIAFVLILWIFSFIF